MVGPPSRGTDASMWARHNDEPASGRDRESGSSFRGTPRGRGRGRPGGSRGGGIHASGKLSVDSRIGELPKSEDMQSATNNSELHKGRAMPRAPIRPSLAVDVLAPPVAKDAPPASPSRSSRRRRQAHKRTASAMQPKSLTPSIAGSVPPSPSTHLMPMKSSKDLPPHLPHLDNSAPVVHDLRKEMANLVDHVRTMAMDQKRPESPGTHIDWAGDDDDSLPDLDDWFTTSKRPSDTSESEPKTDDSVDMIPPPSLEAKPELEAEVPARVTVIESPSTPLVEQIVPEQQQASEAEALQPKRERRRERGRGKKNASLKIDNGAKKSLLERLSDPKDVSKAPSSNERGTDHGVMKATASTIPTDAQLPPKPMPSSDSGKSSDIHVEIVEKEKPRDDAPITFDAPPIFNDASKVPSLDIKPASPFSESPLMSLPAPPATSSATLSVRDRDRSPRTRSQRPMSSDSSPRPSRADRQPFKAHATRHSMPHNAVSGSPSTNGRRQPQASRPILRVDALNMITRTLRDTPAPRRSSPAKSEATS